MSLKGDVIAVGVAGAVLLAAAWYAKKKAGEAADELARLAQQALDEAGHAINPFDEKNLASRAANSIYQAASPNNTGTIGTATYDIVHTPTTTEEVRNLPMGASTAVDIYQWATGSKGDQVNDFKKWWASW